MKTSSKISLILILSIFIISCDNSSDVPAQADKLTGNFQLILSNSEDTNILADLFIQGNIYRSNDTNQYGLNVGKMFISSLSLEYSRYDSILEDYIFGYGISCMLSELIEKPVIGGISNWGYTGNPDLGIDEFFIDIYTPKLPKIIKPNNNFSKVAITGFNIKWDADINNKTMIILTNIPRDSSLPDLGYNFFNDHGWYAKVPDSGDYFMSEEILSKMNKNDTLFIGLYRIMNDTVNTQKYNFIFWRFLESNKSYILQ